MTLPMRPEPLIPVSTMERIRKEDKRQISRRLNMVLVLNVLYLLSMRIAIDVLFKHPWMKDYQQFYPLSIGVLLVLFVLIWVFGRLYILQQRD